MATYKRTGPDGFDYAFPSRRKCPPPPPPKPHDCDCHDCPPPPPPPVEDWGVYPFYPPYQDLIEPVPCPSIPGRPPQPICPPPYGLPKPEKVDESTRRLAKLSQKARVLVQMIKDFEQKNKPAIITIGQNSYQFGTEDILDFKGEAAKGMYSKLICGDPIETLWDGEIETDKDTGRVSIKNPRDLLQSELARVRTEITLVAKSLNKETAEPKPISTKAYVFGTDEEEKEE